MYFDSMRCLRQHVMHLGFAVLDLGTSCMKGAAGQQWGGWGGGHPQSPTPGKSHPVCSWHANE